MFNWDEFRNEKIAVWCDTEEKAREFLDECYKNNITWGKGKIKEPKFDSYKENTCYNFEIDLFNSRLMFTDKSYYEEQNYKIIKWESEKMKFKVGDKVILSNGCRWGDGSECEIITSFNLNNGRSRYKLSGGSLYWFDHELKLYREPTEFTFQEVIARIKQGETYQSIYYASNIQEITKNKKGKILLNLSPCRHIKDEVHIVSDIKFKLQEPKKKVTIYKVEHKKDGKKYDFISNEIKLLQCYEFVVCDTSQGKSYGRIVDLEERELTETEIKQYKECWRA